MKKFTLRTFTQILTACVAIAALFCAIVSSPTARSTTPSSPRSTTITRIGTWTKSPIFFSTKTGVRFEP